MDPNQPITPTNVPPSAQLLPPKKNMPKGLLIGIIAAIIVFLGLAIWLVLGILTKSDKNKENTTDESSVIIRPGYEGESSGVADATALTAKLSGNVTSFQGKTILQPCTLVMLDDLKDNGLLLAANPLTGPVQRIGYTGQGSAATVDANSILLPSETDSNSCRYALKVQGKPGTVAITAWQPFEISERALQRELERLYAPQPDSEGLKVYKNADSNSTTDGETTYIVRSRDATIRLRMNTGNEAAQEKLLSKVVERLQTAASTPTQSVAFDYRSPTMDKSVYRNCEMLSDANFRSVVGLEASQLTEEKFASAVGITEDPKTKKPYNYVSYDCRRTATGKIDGAFSLQTRTYETEEGAAAIFAIERTPEGLAQNVQPVTGIGNEAYYGDFATLGKAVAFRQGRVLVFVTYSNEKTSSAQTPEKRTTTLRPVLEAVAKSLAGF
jgi:hypothetical protein